MKYFVMHYSNCLKPIGWHSSWECSNNDTTETSLEFIHSCICNFQKIFNSMYRRIHSLWCPLSGLQKLHDKKTSVRYDIVPTEHAKKVSALQFI